jgi:hypothetical protein
VISRPGKIHCVIAAALGARVIFRISDARRFASLVRDIVIGT